MKNYSEAFLNYKIKLAELHSSEKKRKATIRLILGFFLGTIVVASIGFLLLFEIPSANRDVVIVLVSGLSGAFFGSVISYYFGDSDSRVEVPEYELGSNNSPENEEEVAIQ